MEPSADKLRAEIIIRCEALDDHVKLLRDYATTPKNVWLARGELNHISECVGTIEGLLTQLKEVD
jgi:hypothetical protein